MFVVAGLVRRVRPEREAFAVALVGLNPVVLFQSAASGHNDLLVALAIAAALALVFSGRELWATAALALGTLVKVTAAVPLLLWWVARRAPGDPRANASGPSLRTWCSRRCSRWSRSVPFANTDDPTLGALELGSHEGWLAPSRFFRRVFDAISGDVLGDRAADRVRARGARRGLPGGEGRLAARGPRSARRSWARRGDGACCA